MGERKGVNKYYPPDFDPAKHGSLNGYRKSHPLRERARKLSQGILIIRFEMPYNIWCDGCKNHIGMGVRYNAEKKKVGNYYTTPIYRFRMKCHLCVNYIEMQTDPASCDYVIVSGAQRKEERWDMKDNEQILTTEHSEKEKLETDPMFKLEHGSQDRGKLQRALPSLSHIQEKQEAWRDDFQLNSALRRKFRDEKKVIKEESERDGALLSKACLSIPLVKETEDDKRLASLLTLHSADSYEDRQRLKRREISARSWFPSPVADRASDTLKRLGLTLGSTSAPSLGFTALPVSKGLGIVRRRSAGSDITAAQEPEASLGVRESDTPRGNDITDAPGGGGTPFDSAQAQTPSAETQAGGCFAGEAEPCTALPLTSLVADYWGSSSESES
ncbi:probable splicing factor YJU2B [Acipenser ruthenus]|uniref:probable splicing factor YJU2B n=1 Tax=Acipenser ruthenus TaxID=7906 RepID=UPI00274054DC|nr:probable splicing factor YJU2B [Acipenser ruthenus]XP_058863972.1 probable splicing factor YJU2B [Acipenser ruthenus]XP_058863973.1 probable splicing factor YJU2B [Acipenser ruthenus]XP_058863974.1 probable splicing factor YJU2B [Acipenser ruthenus]